MSEITRLLSAMDQGAPGPSDQLLAWVYEDLRRLAKRKMAREAPGQTLDATGLVHEAYLRLVESGTGRGWDGQTHFFAAAAEAMRRILVENARRKQSLKRGGDRVRQSFEEAELAAPEVGDDILALDEALAKLAASDPIKAKVVELRFFCGLTIPEAAEALGISTATTERYWAYSRAWLRLEIAGAESGEMLPRR